MQNLKRAKKGLTEQYKTHPEATHRSVLPLQQIRNSILSRSNRQLVVPHQDDTFKPPIVASPPSHLKPVDIYICYDNQSAIDLLLKDKLRKFIASHALTFYIAARARKDDESNESQPPTQIDSWSERSSRKSHKKEQKKINRAQTSLLIGLNKVRAHKTDDVRASPNVSVKRRASISTTRPINPEQQLDMFDHNVAAMEASSMILFITSPISIKSADCCDEIHYSYEQSKTIIQVRSTEIPVVLLSGSMGMMLHSVPSVDFYQDNAEISYLELLLILIKKKLELLKQTVSPVVMVPTFISTTDDAVELCESPPPPPQEEFLQHELIEHQHHSLNSSKESSPIHTPPQEPFRSISRSVVPSSRNPARHHTIIDIPLNTISSESLELQQTNTNQ